MKTWLLRILNYICGSHYVSTGRCWHTFCFLQEESEPDKSNFPKATQLISGGIWKWGLTPELTFLSSTSCPNTSRWIFSDWLNVVFPTVIKLPSLKCNMSQSKYLLGVQLQFPAESMPAPRNTLSLISI